jgi:hypothetical protein
MPPTARVGASVLVTMLEETHNRSAIVRNAGTCFERGAAISLEQRRTFIPEPFVDACETVAKIDLICVGLNWTTPRWRSHSPTMLQRPGTE